MTRNEVRPGVRVQFVGDPVSAMLSGGKIQRLDFGTIRRERYSDPAKRLVYVDWDNGQSFGVPATDLEPVSHTSLIPQKRSHIAQTTREIRDTLQLVWRDKKEDVTPPIKRPTSRTPEEAALERRSYTHKAPRSAFDFSQDLAVTEASDIGLRPGDWPEHIEIVDEQSKGVLVEFSRLEEKEGEVLWAEYYDRRGTIPDIKIYND